MDAKTMIYFLKPDGLMKDGNRVVLLADEIANEISDYIERQEKYAELGRLAVEVSNTNPAITSFVKLNIRKNIMAQILFAIRLNVLGVISAKNEPNCWGRGVK
ncbi:MAG: hypothetical protein K0R55_4651 [Sporomusa sp.]|jgi:hypothetical protein|nr:hypothetical protein [Sporomusa sp.]